MTLDEAIKHCLEVAEQNETSAITYKNCKEFKTNMYEKLTAEKVESDCRECAADHRQLAEWLTELKEAKRLLKAAVEDIRHCMRYYDPCEVCALLEENGECVAADDDDCSEKYKWCYETEALALIGEDTNVHATADDIIVGRRLDGWISCEERLPEESGTYICAAKSAGRNIVTFVKWQPRYKQWNLTGARSYWQITHWQPLPEPPKIGGAEDENS